jgi:hypothetical protein
MHEGDRLSILARWLADAGERIHGQVRVDESEQASGKQTVVSIDHRLSCPLDAHDGWRISTKPTFLPREHFSSQARHYLKTAEPGRGRTIYCHDMSLGEVVAALSYHIDENRRIPVLLTTIGFRIDAGASAFLSYGTLAGALVLKQYVHAVAAKTNRGGYVDIDLAASSCEGLVRELGFQNAPRVRGFRPGGLHLRQPAPGT